MHLKHANRLEQFHSLIINPFTNLIFLSTNLKLPNQMNFNNRTITKQTQVDPLPNTNTSLRTSRLCSFLNMEHTSYCLHNRTIFLLQFFKLLYNYLIITLRPPTASYIFFSLLTYSYNFIHFLTTYNYLLSQKGTKPCNGNQTKGY
uniref:Uncharacterized protein n=1 Tax=Opuntia streptacantha TaxID=393608 RepID=A0A7C9D2B5_OPUST